MCDKRKVKCAECPNRALLPLDDEVLRDHLSGSKTVGIYPLLPDETCWFLAVDFDKTAWQDDAAAFLVAAEAMGIPAALERSRSGQGGHVWIFFDQALSAFQARRLGSSILARAMERRHQMGLDSYDRFFPNQDTLPKGRSLRRVQETYAALAADHDRNEQIVLAVRRGRPARDTPALGSRRGEGAP